MNYILPHTAPDAEVVAVIDADYCVDKTGWNLWCRTSATRKIAVVQSPQDYRDGNEKHLQKLCYAEYKGFFHIGMVTRNDRDADHPARHHDHDPPHRDGRAEVGRLDHLRRRRAGPAFGKDSAAYAHQSFGRG